MKNTYFTGVDNCLKPLLKKGVEKGVFSGAAVGLYKRTKKGDEKLVICHGKTKNGPHATPVKENTLFDLASLTKPLCTVPAILHLIKIKKINWNTKLEALFGTKTPEFLKKIQIANLLSHSSGLKAYEPFYQHFKPIQKKENHKRLIDFIFNEKLVYKTGEKCIYSDLGYILLGEIIERVSEKKLNTFFASKIAGPLGLEKLLMFRPVGTSSPGENKETAATQYCPWRKRLLQGEVDDEHSWLLNGVAGHAGLFGTIQGVLGLTAHLLNQWQGREEHPSYDKELLTRALTRQYKDQTWCLGFDTPSTTGSSGGAYLSEKSVGHLGFTGTSFWIDPEKDMVMVLLTNRVHPTRNNEKIKQFRPQLHDTVFKCMQAK